MPTVTTRNPKSFFLTTLVNLKPPLVGKVGFIWHANPTRSFQIDTGLVSSWTLCVRLACHVAKPTFTRYQGTAFGAHGVYSPTKWHPWAPNAGPFAYTQLFGGEKNTKILVSHLSMVFIFLFLFFSGRVDLMWRIGEVVH